LIWAAGQVKAFTSRAETRFLLAWIVPFWVMIELIPTKLPHYPLPVLPALILLLIGGVAVLAKPADGTAKWRYYLGISLRYLGIAVGLVMALVVIWGAMTFGGETSRQALGFAFLGLGVAALAAWFGHLWIRQALWRPFFGMIGAAMLFHMIVFSGVFPAFMFQARLPRRSPPCPPHQPQLRQAAIRNRHWYFCLAATCCFLIRQKRRYS
jgi:4-amino-4-deoxy-L-arabinose transferase-like glycosyltransferase